jgi:molybdopterin converting factor small subunit
MSQEQEKARTENLKQMLAANKARLARNKVISIYQHELGYPLRADQFLDVDRSQRLLREIYQQMRTVPARTFATVQEVRGELAQLKEAWRAFSDQHVILFYRNRVPVQQRDYIAAGGIKLVLEEVWNMLEHLRGDEPEDIVVSEEGLAFGFCVEAAEYEYELTCWGLEKPEGESEKEEIQ